MKATIDVPEALYRKVKARKGKAIAGAIRGIPLLEWVESGASLMEAALEEGARSYLRGADAVYVAVALQRRTRLITWDEEMLARVRMRPSPLSPKDWMRAG